MNIKRIYKEFEELAEQLGIKIVLGRGNFTGDYCMVEEEKVIVVNKNKPLEQRVKRLAVAFSMLDLSNVYVKPIIRQMIEAEKEGSLFS